jgi:hypothetical protein
MARGRRLGPAAADGPLAAAALRLPAQCQCQRGARIGRDDPRADSERAVRTLAGEALAGSSIGRQSAADGAG